MKMLKICTTMVSSTTGLPFMLSYLLNQENEKKSASEDFILDFKDMFTEYDILCCVLLEFSLNVFTEFTGVKTVLYLKKNLFEPVTSRVRDQDATTAPARHS